MQTRIYRNSSISSEEKFKDRPVCKSIIGAGKGGGMVYVPGEERFEKNILYLMVHGTVLETF